MEHPLIHSLSGNTPLSNKQILHCALDVLKENALLGVLEERLRTIAPTEFVCHAQDSEQLIGIQDALNAFTSNSTISKMFICTLGLTQKENVNKHTDEFRVLIGANNPNEANALAAEFLKSNHYAPDDALLRGVLPAKETSPSRFKQDSSGSWYEIVF